MQDLVNEMTNINPVKRPVIEDIVAKFSYIRKSLSGFKLRSLLVSKRKPSLFTLQYIFSRKAAIPEA